MLRERFSAAVGTTLEASKLMDLVPQFGPAATPEGVFALDTVVSAPEDADGVVAPSKNVEVSPVMFLIASP